MRQDVTHTGADWGACSQTRSHSLQHQKMLKPASRAPLAEGTDLRETPGWRCDPCRTILHSSPENDPKTLRCRVRYHCDGVSHQYLLIWSNVAKTLPSWCAPTCRKTLLISGEFAHTRLNG